MRSGEQARGRSPGRTCSCHRGPDSVALRFSLSVSPRPYSRPCCGAYCILFPPPTRCGHRQSQRGSSVRFISIFGALLAVALVLTVGALFSLLMMPFRAALAFRRA